MRRERVRQWRSNVFEGLEGKKGCFFGNLNVRSRVCFENERQGSHRSSWSAYDRITA